MRELLDMTSGIRDVGGARPWQAQLESIAKDPLLYAPGTESLYSSANYDLLGELIEQWTGEKYGTFIQDQILGPLGMSGTQELGRSATVPNQAVGYDAPRHGSWPRAEVQNGPAMYAAAGMVSTAQDMATYMTALLEWPSPRSRDLRVDVDLDTDAAIRGESSLQRRARPGMGYGDRHERRAHRGHQERAGPRIHL
jgi:CubicO group peptidase (beta-lactamase class C family)